MGGGVLLTALLISSLIFFSCANNSGAGNLTPEQKPDEPVVKSLKSLIVSANEGDTIDLSMVRFTAEDGESYRIRKNKLTIKNGDVKNAKFNVESDGVVFENLSNIGKLTISERVGDGDFTIKDCPNVAEFYVNGGGSESIHISGTSVAKLTVNKSGVRIAVDKGDTATTIAKAFLLKDCKVESKDEETSLTKVVVAETVQTVSFVGKAVVEAIVSAVEDATPKIVVETAVKIKAADEAVKNSIKEKNADYNTSAIGTAAISEDEKKESAAVAEEANVADYVTSLEDMESIDESLKVSELVAVDTEEGIRINYKLQGTDDDYKKENIRFFYFAFIEGVGNVINKTVESASGYFVYPFVQKDKEYKVRLSFYKQIQHNGVAVQDVLLEWNDITLIAKGGKGESKLKLYPTISLKNNGDLTFTAPNFSDEKVVAGWKMAVQCFTGDSWNVKNGRGWKWIGEPKIMGAYITNKYNIFEMNEKYENLYGIPDFIFFFIVYDYTDSDEAEWSYRWEFLGNDVVNIELDPSSYQKKDTTP